MSVVQAERRVWRNALGYKSASHPGGAKLNEVERRHHIAVLKQRRSHLAELPPGPARDAIILAPSDTITALEDSEKRLTPPARPT